MAFTQMTPFPAAGRTVFSNLVDRFGGTAINVRDDYGAKGDGTTDDTAALQAALNAAFGTTAQTTQRRVIIPPGKFIVRGAGLTGKNWFGGCLHGSGRFATMVKNVDGGPVITTDGCQYMRFGDMQLDSNSGTAAATFDLDFKGVGTALQSNTFENIYFSDGYIGLRIGKSDFMGSENLILNCFFANYSYAGLQAVGFNALQQTVLGGNFQNCGIGVDVVTGSVPVVHGVGFQQSSVADIMTHGASNNTMSITGCRTESPNFVNNAGTQAMEIRACLQDSPTRGLFYTGMGGMVDISACMFNGRVFPNGWTRLCMRACEPFGQVISGDWLVKQPVPNWWYVPNNPQALVIELENILPVLNTGTAEAPIGKQRIFTSDGQTVTTQNYVVA